MLGTEAMTCQELLALSGALSAALPTGQLGLGSFFTSLSKGGKLQVTAASEHPKGALSPPSISKLLKKHKFCTNGDIKTFA
jgi:hypothetical protein